jgi:serine/threonine protein kinase
VHSERRDLILEEALSMEGRARERFLAAACAGDGNLRREIERLLEVDARDEGAFLDRPPISVAAPLLNPGDRVGRYIVQCPIGSGGMSRVYEAEDTVIGRAVALKMLHAVGATNEERRRFFRELQLLGRMQHDHVVRVYDFGEHDGTPYLVMERLRGEDLSDSIAGRRTGDLSQRLDIALQVAVALHEIHEAGIVHRDIKPANVFLEADGRAKLLDFGIAQHAPAHTHVTAALIGTPEYFAPERMRGQATAASDVYSYGVLLFQMFAGRKPFTGDLVEILSGVAFQPLPVEPLARAGVPERLTRLIMRLTAKDPAARPTLDGVISELTAVAAELGVRPRRHGTTLTSRPRRSRVFSWGAAGGALGAAAISIVGAFMFVQQSSSGDAQLPPVVVSSQTPATATAADDTTIGVDAPVAMTHERREAAPPAQSTGASTVEPSRRAREADTPQPVPSDEDDSPTMTTAATPTVPNGAATPDLVFVQPRIDFGVVPPAVGTRNPNRDAPAEAVQVSPQFDDKQDRDELQRAALRLAAAFRDKSIDELRTLWPTLNQEQTKQIGESFARFKAVEYTLVPDGDALVTRASGREADAASLRAHRRVRMTPYTGPAPPAVQDMVVLAFQRRGSSWVVVGID